MIWFYMTDAFENPSGLRSGHSIVKAVTKTCPRKSGLIPFCAGALLRICPALVAMLCAALLLAACAGNPVLDEARRLIGSGQLEDGVALLKAESDKTPSDGILRTTYFRERDVALSRLASAAESARLAGDGKLAAELYQRAAKMDDKAPRVQAGMLALERDAARHQQLAVAEKLITDKNYAAAQEIVARAAAEDPQSREVRGLQRRLHEAAGAPTPMPQFRPEARRLTLDFRDANLRSIFEVISRTANVNFIFDRDVRPDVKASLVVKDTSVAEIVDVLLLTSQLDKKALNDNTLIVFPNTAAKKREYQELVVRAFYLTNADAKQVVNLIRTMVKTRDLYVDEKLNLIVMKDTPEAIKLAEQLIATSDIAEPEVMLEVEVLEIATTKLENLGIRWPTQVSFSAVGAAGTLGQLTKSEFDNLNSSLLRVNLPNPLLTLSFGRTDGTVNLLANPRIRVKNREKAKIHVGDRVPVITSTSGAAGNFVSQSVSYLDVGLKLEVEPNITLDDEVAIKVQLEVSSITREINGAGAAGTLAYQIGTRNASTILRLRDGESQVLAGLIRDDERRTADGISGLSQLPLLGRLFSSRTTDTNKTEIALIITPRIVRNMARPLASQSEIRAGTDASVGGTAAAVSGSIGGTGGSAPGGAMPIAQPPPPGSGLRRTPN